MQRIRADARACIAYTVQSAQGLLNSTRWKTPSPSRPSCQAALGQRLGALELNRYPARATPICKPSLAGAARTDARRLRAGVGCNGSMSLISLVQLVVRAPWRRQLAPLPGFVAYGMSAAAGTVVCGRRVTPDFELDEAAMEAAIAQHRPAITLHRVPEQPDGHALGRRAPVQRTIDAAGAQGVHRGHRRGLAPSPAAPGSG